MQYAKRTPGRLASRLLLKMQVEGAQGAVGAKPADRGELTPPAAVHYFHTMIVPQLGQRLGMRADREMRTLCTALDLLARKLPAHAADVLGQRLKAIEKSCHDGHWQAAQFLELFGPDSGGLLERDEEVFMNREHLLELLTFLLCFDLRGQLLLLFSLLLLGLCALALCGALLPSELPLKSLHLITGLQLIAWP